PGPPSSGAHEPATQELTRDERRRPRVEATRKPVLAPPQPLRRLRSLGRPRAHRPRTDDFARNFRSLPSGQVLITSSASAHPRCAVPTPKRISERWPGAWESVSTANFTPL